MKTVKALLSLLFRSVFGATLILSSLTAWSLLTSPAMDIGHFLVLKQHIRFGLLFMFIFFIAFFTHMRRYASFAKAALATSTFLLFYITLLIELRPMEAFLLSCLLSALLALKLIPYDGKSNGSYWRAGILCWILFNMVLSTGVYMAGPIKSFRTDFFNQVHKTVSFIVLPVFIVHGLLPMLSRATLQKAVLIAAGIALLFFFSLKALDERSPAHEAYGETPPTKPYARYNMKNPRTCGERLCHSEIYKEWKLSSHRLSAANPVYRKTLALFAKEQGEKETVFCERCHNPDRFILSEDAKDKKARKFFTQNGVSCLSCHLIEKGDTQKGDGVLLTRDDTPYLPGFYPRTSPQWRFLYGAIRTDLRQHRKNYQKTALYKSSEFCNICHSLTIPSKYNRSQPVFIPGPYASWKNSVYAKEGITCAHCHLQLFEFKDTDSMERPFHARPDHRMFGLNRIPPGAFEEAVLSKNDIQTLNKETQKFISGNLSVSKYELLFLRYVRDGRHPAYAKHYRNKSALLLNIQPTLSSASGGKICFSVITTNETIGHDFPGGLLNMIQAWLEVTVKDAEGRLLYRSGLAGKNGTLPHGTHTLGAAVKDFRGNPISHHKVWETAVLADKRVIHPKENARDDFCFKPAVNARAPVNIRARWLYRRCSPSLCEWVFGKKNKFYPVTVLGTAERNISLQ